MDKYIAARAANEWCRCYKCNGVINETHLKCDKDNVYTCPKWYDSYRAALIALEMHEKEHHNMDFTEYSKAIRPTRDCPSSIFYSALGLAGEAGEVVDKIKKYWRDKVYKNGEDCDHGLDLMDKDTKEGIIKEMGDVMWYLSDLADLLGVSLGTVAQTNLQKIKGRVERGTLHGEGDDR